MASSSSSSGDLSPSKITTVLADPLFHGYNQCLIKLGSIFKRLSRWMEGCPCHTTTMELCSQQHGRRVAKMFPRFGHCPLSGCHGPEIAAGSLSATLDQLVKMSTASVLASLPGDAGERCCMVITEDMQSARAYLELGMRVKFDCYQRLPWALMGLAHYNKQCQVDAAKKVLKLFADTEAIGFASQQHHPVTQKFLAEGPRHLA